MTKYARGVGGLWSVDATWSTTSGGSADTTKPTAADDARLDAASGAVTIDSGALCRSLDCTGYTGTLTHNAITLTIGDGTAGAGDVAFKLVAGMTYTLVNANNSSLTFASTSGTAQTIDPAGKATGNMFFSGVGGSWIFSSAVSIPVGAITHTGGTLNTNGQTVGLGSFSSSSTNVRSIILGTSVVTLGATGLVWTLATVTNLTLSAASSTITLTGTNSSFRHGTSGSVVGAYGTVNMNGASIATIDGTTANTFVAITRNGTAAKTDTLNFGGNYTITTLTINSNSDVNRVLVQSTVFQATRILTCASVVITNTVDFIDITGAGAATWTVAGTGATALGDGQGNSGITFTTPTTQTHDGTTSNYSTAARWTSRVPLPQDTVLVPSGSGTITGDMPRIGADVDFTGFTGTFIPNVQWSLQGSLTFASGMTFTQGTFNCTANGRGTHIITSSGKSFYNFIVNSATTSTYTFADAVTCTDTGLTIGLTAQRGTVTWQGNVTASVFISGSSNSKTFNMGSGTWSLTGTSGTLWSVAGTPVVINANTSTIVISSASTSARTFAGGTQTFNNLTYTVDNSPGSLTITGANTFANLNVDSGKILTLPSATTTTIASSGTFNVNGAVNGYIYMPAVAGNYMSVPDSVPLSITGDIDVRVRLAPDDWTPVTAYTIFCKLQTAGNRSWQLLNNGTGAPGFLGFSLYADGTTATTASASVATGLTDGVVSWIRATWRQSDGRVQFFTAPGGVLNPTSGDWTQLGTDRSAVIASIFDSTAIVEVGSNQLGVGSPTPGKFYRAQIRNNILDDGTGIVFDADFTTKTVGVNSFAEGSSNAATVTINGVLAQAGDGRVSLVSSSAGTAATVTKVGPAIVEANYLSIQDSAATGASTGWYARNSINVSGNTGWNFSDYTGRIPVESRRTAVSGRIASTRTVAVTGRTLIT